MKVRRGGFSVIAWLLIIMAMLFAIIPIAWIMICSIQPDSALYTYPPKWLPRSIDLSNYLMVLTRTSIPRDMLNSLIVCACAVLLGLFCSSLFAYGLSRSRSRHKGGIMLTILIAQMIPPIILILPLYLLMYEMHLLNTYVSLILVYATQIMPLSVIMLTGFYDSIPQALDESAHIDGCNRFQIFFLLFRLVVPGLAAMAVLGFVIVWNEFIVSLTLISESVKKTYQLGLYDLMVNITTHYMRYGIFNGAAMLGLIPMLIAYMFSNKFFIAGLTEGSVK